MNALTKRALIIFACGFVILSQAAVLIGIENYNVTELSLRNSEEEHIGSEPRRLAHIFQQSSNLVWIAFKDRAATNNGLVIWSGRNPRQKSFTVSHATFENMWTTLMTNVAPEYAGNAHSHRSFDTVNNYVFSAATTDKLNTDYVIPINEASPGIISLAEQFRAFAK